MRTEVPKQKPKKKRYENRCSGKKTEKNDMTTGASENPQKKTMRRDAPRKPRKIYMRTGAPATKNPEKTI